MYALNFYSPMVADQLRSGRKSATIRLGDKSGKYKKGMVVQVLCGVRFGARERVFEAVIDKVEVKSLAELSPREIEHDNPEIRRTDEMARFLGQLYNREVGTDELVTVIRFSQILNGKYRTKNPCSGRFRGRGLTRASYVDGFLARRIGEPKSSSGRSAPPHSSQSTAAIDENGALQLGQRRSRTPPHCGHVSGTSASNWSNQRRAAPQPRQTATQSPSTLRRSSRSQSDALPTLQL